MKKNVSKLITKRVIEGKSLVSFKKERILPRENS